MTRMDKPANFSRRAVLKAGGALVVSIGTPISFEAAQAAADAFAQGTKPPLVPSELASFIAVNADGTVSAYFGKMDMGQGLFVAIGQIVAEELDVPFKSVNVIMGDTATSVNQGGASGSTGVQDGGKQMRVAAAEARRVLVEMAAEKLGVPADQLAVTDGVVHGKSDAAKKVSYADLIGGRYFNVQLEWNKKYGNPLYAPGQGQAERSEGAQDRRPADQARRHRAEGVCPGGLRYGRQSARHGAWPHDPSGDHRRRAGEGRRKLDQGHPRRQSRMGQRTSSASSPTKNGTRSRRRKNSRSTGPTPSRRSRIKARSMTTSATPRCASTRKRARRPAMSTTPSRMPRASSRRNMSGRTSRMPAWARPAHWSKSRTATLCAGAAPRSRTSCAPASPARSACPRIRCT